MTRRRLGTGPTAAAAAAELTGARLLPVERLSSGPGTVERLEGEQRPQEGVQRPGRRPLGQRAREQLLEPERRP